MKIMGFGKKSVCLSWIVTFIIVISFIITPTASFVLAADHLKTQSHAKTINRDGGVADVLLQRRGA
ncbi:MAG: hypothetical protein PHC33_04070 [Candidatus Omnitrophica bacterium]|nr:hypothetical protein [Candidatus Omnitrophota bacterium]